MTDALTFLQQSIVANGYRLTTARQAIIGALAASDGHITADDLAVEVRRRSPQIGRMTVYRTLDLLSELGVIRAIYQGTGAAHYILLVGGSHHHFICNRCHTVFEFDNCSADEVTRQMAGQLNFQVQSHLLEVHGLCADCQN